MANFANPTVGSNYTDFPGEIRASVNAALQQLSVGSHTNIPTGAIKFDTSANRWKKFNGSAFVDLTSTYDLNANVSVNQLNLGDNEQIRLGNSQDLLVYHNGSDSYIEDNGTGKLVLTVNGPAIHFFDSPGNKAMARFITGGSCELYEDGTKRLETDGNGIQVTDRVGIGGTASNSLDVFGNIVQFGGSNTNDQQLRVGRSGSGNRNAYIDLIGDNTYSTYGLRIIRFDGGANAASDLRHRGTGDFRLMTQDSAHLRFFTGSAEKAVITTGGRLGIGTTSPDSRLDVLDSAATGIISRCSNTQNTDSNKALRIRNNSNTNTFHISYRGAGYFARQVLIGTSSGRSPGGLVPNLQVEGTNSSTSSLSLTRNSADTGSASLTFNKTRGTSVGADVAVNNADTLGIIQFVGNDGTDSDNPAAWIVGKVDGNPSSNVMPGRLEFYTNTGGTSVSLRATIKEGGAFLIGKTSPAATGNSIETAGAARFQAPSDFWSTASAFYGVAGYGYLGTHGAFETTLVSGGYRKGSSQWQNYTINGVTGNATMIAMGTQSSYIAFRLQTGKTTGSSSGVSDRVRFFPTGSVSIGSTTEKSKLYINGGESESGGILVENVLYAGNQDKPILIAGTQNHTGATTNWGTYGFQIRLKTNSGGSPRLTVDTDNGEMVCVRNNNFVGIGTDSPERLVHIVGSDCRIKLSDSDVTTDFEIQNVSGNGVLTTNAATPIIIKPNNSEACRIDATGRFMINRTSADFHLDVAGAARISNYLYMANAQRIQWGGSNVSYIQGDDNSYLLFAVASETFRITGTGLRIGQTGDTTPGLGDTNTGASIEKNGRFAGSTSGTETGISLNANTTSTTKHYCSFRRSGTQIASIKAESSGVSYNTGSDRRLKENIVDIKDALLILLKLKPKEYNWKSDKNKVTEHGFIAQDLLEDKLCEYAVSYSEEDDFYGMDYGRLTAITIAAIQELAGKVSDLESKLA